MRTDSHVYSSSLSVLDVIQIVLIILKLVKVINWSWWVVLIPAEITLVVFLLAVITIIILAKMNKEY